MTETPTITPAAVIVEKSEIASIISQDGVDKSDGHPQRKFTKQPRHDHCVGFLEHNLFKVKKILAKTRFHEHIEDSE